MFFYKQIHRNISDIYVFQDQRIEIAGDIGIWTFLSHISSKCFDSGGIFVLPCGVIYVPIASLPTRDSLWRMVG